MKSIILSSLLIFTLNAKCLSGKISYIDNKKEVIQKVNYCTKPFLISQKCHKKGCERVSRLPVPLKIPNFLSPIGSPGFKLCRALSGSPQIAKYWHNNRWRPVTRCIFENDEFVDISYLMKRWKPYIRH